MSEDDTARDATQLSLPGDPSGSQPEASIQGRPSVSGNIRLTTDRLLRLSGESDAFEDQFEFLDDIHGSIQVNRLERDAIDSPEFQRLFRLGQLGFVDLVYPTANHTRGTHSIGACFWAKKLVDKLNENDARFNRTANTHQQRRPIISKPERDLISLAGLLHDLPHGPLSHDIEKKTHYIYVHATDRKLPTRVKSYYGPYEKHDNFAENPALYIFLLDTEHSLLARILRAYSPAFARELLAAAVDHPHIRRFTDLLPTAWPQYPTELLPHLLLHLLIFEKSEQVRNPSISLRASFSNESRVEWGLGPLEARSDLHEAWYQGFRHDIVGDTLSADLLDYLARDQARLRMRNELDLKLLKNYILVRWTDSEAKVTTYRCAIDLIDEKRGTFRAERLNDIFRLLDLRHQIHEKAVYHRVVQSAVSMLSRIGLILGDRKPTLGALYGFDTGMPALAGDDRFLGQLVNASRPSPLGQGPPTTADVHQGLACKLAERRVYRPLMVIPGDRVPVLLRDICDFENGLEHPLRELAAIVDSRFFAPFFMLVSTGIERLLQHAIPSEESLNDFLLLVGKDEHRLARAAAVLPQRVIFWTTPYKQLYKDPAILVRVSDLVTTTIDHLPEHGVSRELRARIDAGVRDAETKNEALWKFYVFLSDGLFYTGVFARLLAEHPCERSPQHHATHLVMAQNVVVRALRCSWQYWQARHKSLDLSQECPKRDLAMLLQLLVGDSGWFKLGAQDLPAAVSAVRVDQYLHGDASPKCRDVRYKFDAGLELAALLERFVPEPETRALVREAIRATGVDPRQMMGEEMGEAVLKFASAPELLPNLVDIAARNSPVRDDTLREVWLSDLR